MTKDEAWLWEEKYIGEKSEAFFADCERLKKGEPLAYVIGFVPFLDCKIWLDSRPLIPRGETEFWTDVFITKISTPNQPEQKNLLTILDLCAGSGCVGVAVAKRGLVGRVDFAEIDASHLPTIAKNLAENDVDPAKTTIIQSDLFSNVVGQYDYILSNPPYIDPTLNRVEKSVQDFEPANALYGGRHGLELINSIIATAPAHLHPHGQLWIEHEPEQASAIHELAKANHFASVTHNDQYNTPRWSILVLQ